MSVKWRASLNHIWFANYALKLILHKRLCSLSTKTGKFCDVHACKHPKLSKTNENEY